MKELPHSRSCFVCGEFNPLGFKLRFHTDGQIVKTRVTPRQEHIGFKGTVHGGMISTLLDELMAWVCAVQTKHFCYCAELTVRFLQVVPPGHEVEGIGELVSNRRNKIFVAKAELRDLKGKVLASGTGKYLPVRAADTKEMAEDLMGDPNNLL